MLSFVGFRESPCRLPAVCWLRTSFSAASVWMCSMFQSLYRVDTTSAKSASSSTGTAASTVSAPRAKNPSIKSLTCESTLSYRRWRVSSGSQPDEAAAGPPNQETFPVTSAATLKWKLWSPAWCVWRPTVRLTCSLIWPPHAWKNISWLILWRIWRAGCVRSTINLWSCSARPTRPASACSALF